MLNTCKTEWDLKSLGAKSLEITSVLKPKFVYVSNETMQELNLWNPKAVNFNPFLMLKSPENFGVYHIPRFHDIFPLSVEHWVCAFVKITKNDDFNELDKKWLVPKNSLLVQIKDEKFPLKSAENAMLVGVILENECMTSLRSLQETLCKKMEWSW